MPVKPGGFLERVLALFGVRGSRKVEGAQRSIKVENVTVLCEAIKKWPLPELFKIMGEIQRSPSGFSTLLAMTDHAGFFVFPMLLKRPAVEVAAFFKRFGFSFLKVDLARPYGANSVSSQVLDYFVENDLVQLIVSMIEELPLSFIRINQERFKQLMEKETIIADAVFAKIVSFISSQKELSPEALSRLADKKQTPESFFLEANNHLSWEDRF